MTNEIAAMWLSEMKGMTPLKCYALFQCLESLKEVVDLSCKQINDYLGASLKDRHIQKVQAEAFYQHLKKLGTYEQRMERLGKDQFVLTPDHKAFPPLLRELEDCPTVLYARSGLISQGFSFPELNVGVVGSRRCTLYGKDTATKLSGELAEQGVGVISGLAYGIDVAAHRGALAKGGFTVAVLGGGLNQCYPKQHIKVFEEIAAKGMLISEEWFETATESYMFPKRNRIISGISHGVLVVEAAKKSGSLITADFALEQNRDVYAVPGRILDPKSAGSNGLIRQGAKAVFDVEDILEEYMRSGHSTQCEKEQSEKKLEEKEKIVYSCISYEPVHQETIMMLIQDMVEMETGHEEIKGHQAISLGRELVDITADDVTISLMVLELKGLIKKISGCYYARSEE